MKNLINVISDIGTISEESAILNFPDMTIRNTMERPEAQDTESVILTGLNINDVVSAIDLLIKGEMKIQSLHIPVEYQINDTSGRVIKLLTGAL